MRSIFNVDRYRRIQDNARISARELGRKINYFEGMISDLGSKKEELDALKKDIDTLNHDFLKNDSVAKKYELE